MLKERLSQQLQVGALYLLVYAYILRVAISNWLELTTCFWVHAAETINNTDEDRLGIIRLARNIPGFMIKKVHVWSLFIVQLEFYVLHTAHIHFLLYSLQVQCSLRLTPQCC